MEARRAEAERKAIADTQMIALKAGRAGRRTRRRRALIQDAVFAIAVAIVVVGAGCLRSSSRSYETLGRSPDQIKVKNPSGTDCDRFKTPYLRAPTRWSSKRGICGSRMQETVWC